jgi:hypothetical protein
VSSTYTTRLSSQIPTGVEMDVIASETAKSAATATMGSVISNATEKGVQPAKNSDVSQTVKIGVKVSEVVLSSIVTSLAITMFGRYSKKIKGNVAFVTLMLAVSVACALLTAYIKMVL